MALYHNPRMPRGGLRVAIDPSNPRCYSGSGNDVKNLNQRDAITTPTAVATTTDSGRTVFNNNATPTNIQISLNPVINHETWSLIFWVKYNALPSSDYRNLIRLRDDVNPNGVGYFYIVDSRQTTNNYILGYQKDQAVSSWTSHSFGSNQTNYQSGDWRCCAVTHNNGVFKGYGNGTLLTNQTVSLNVDLYGNINEFNLFWNNNTGSLVGPTYMYERVLTDDEMLQAYNCHKDVFQ